MAYGIKYSFHLESTNGVEYAVNILKDGYSGSVIVRPLGKAPVLKKSRNGNIGSTTLDLEVECAVDGEFAEFYTTSPGEYLVALFKNNTQIWQGALVTELYSAPEIAPPYDVKITANDGIALSKEFLYEAQGAVTPKELVKGLLSDIPNLGRSIYIVSGIGATDLTPANFWNTALINLDYMAGKTKYDVLNYFLSTIHATITLHNGNWLIARETDVTVSSGSIACLIAARNSNNITSSSITGAVASAGKMGVADLWPVGHMSTNVVPAKRRVTVEAPNHSASGAPSVSGNGWAIYDSEHVLFQGGSYIFTYATLDDDYGTIYAQIPFRSFTKKLKLTISVATYLAYVYTNKSDLRIYVSFTPTGGTIKYFNGMAWVGSPTRMARLELPKPVGTIESPEEYSFEIAPIDDFADGTFIISFEGRRVRLYDAVLETVIGNGYKDTIVIDNGARGDEPAVTIAGARVDSDDVVSAAFLQGVFLLSSGAPAENFYDTQFSGSDLSFMSLTALGYALSVALPRLDLSGTFNFPSSLSTIPLVLTYGGIKYWVETYELNMLEEELKISAKSLPSATLTVEGEVVTELSDAEASGSSGSGGGSSGGGTVVNSGTSLLRVWQTLTNNDELTDYDATTKIALEHLSSFLELVEYSTGHFALKVKPSVTVSGSSVTIDGLYSEGFITAGGIHGSGGGSGVDLDRVWDSLTNNTDKPNVKINAAHIPVATASAIGGVKVDGTTITIQNGVISAVAQGGGSVNSLTVGSTNYTPDSGGVITIPAYPTSLPASDVYSWAKASTKPSYNLSEIGSAGDVQAIEALTGTGFLKRTGADTWTLDSSTYLTAVPKATDSVIGGFQTGYSESGKNYAVKMSGNKAYVNVPWTDTVYTHPTNGADTTITAANGKVLSAITVNSLGHVTSVSSKTLAVADMPDLSSVYLPLTGGTLTGDLRLKTGGGNYGSKLNFGDGDYVFLYEDTDDHLQIKGADGIELIVGSDEGIKFGDGVLKWDSTYNAWHLEGNFYADGFITAGGINGQSSILVTISGEQTITGAKTFSADTTFSGRIGVGGAPNNAYALCVTGSQSMSGSLTVGGSATITSGLGVGTAWAGSTYKLVVNGSARATAWDTTSDRRLKENIVSIDPRGAVEKLMQLKPVSWTWNKLCGSAGKAGVGFVAQDVEDVIPQMVHDGDEFKSLNYTMMHAFEVAGFQDHERRIAELERENGELRTRLGL